MKIFSLGDTVKDEITGFTGVVICKSTWLNGCVRLMVQRTKLDKDGKPVPAESFDVEQLVLVKAAKGPAHAPAGGPMPDPVRR